MQTSADHGSRRRHDSRMTDERDEIWSFSGMLKVLFQHCTVNVLTVVH